MSAEEAVAHCGGFWSQLDAEQVLWDSYDVCHCPSAWGKRTRECQCEVSEDYSKTIEGNCGGGGGGGGGFNYFFFVPLPSADGCFCWFGARWFGFLGFSGSQRWTISWYLRKLTGSGGKVTRGGFHTHLWSLSVTISMTRTIRIGCI